MDESTPVHRLTRLAKYHDLDIEESSDAIGLAIEVASGAHAGREEWGDEPRINHVLRVAKTVREFYPNAACVIAALLHETVSNTSLTLEGIEELFGEDIVFLVDGLTTATQNPLRESLIEAHPYVKLVALADLFHIDTSTFIKQDDPGLWEERRGEMKVLLNTALKPFISGKYGFDMVYRELFKDAIKVIRH